MKIASASIVFILLASSCYSQSQETAAQELADVVTAATKDGLVTDAEAEAINAKMRAYVDAPGVNWAELGGTVLASVVATFLGLTIAPNHMIVGKAEAAALNKVAGIK